MLIRIGVVEVFHHVADLVAALRVLLADIPIQREGVAVAGDELAAVELSLGAEFGYSILFRTANRGLVTSERWNPVTNAVLETKTDLNNNGYFTFLGANLDNLNSSINLIFYF